MRVRKGELWNHYKGGKYKIISVCTHTETQKTYIVYQSVEDGREWLRPAKMFHQKVTVNGKKIRRFTKVKEEIK